MKSATPQIIGRDDKSLAARYSSAAIPKSTIISRTSTRYFSQRPSP